MIPVVVAIGAGAFSPGSTSTDSRTANVRATGRSRPARRRRATGVSVALPTSEAPSFGDARIVITRDPIHERVEHLGAIGDRAGEDARCGRNRARRR